MLIMDMPGVPPQQTPIIMMAQASQPSTKELYGTVGVCTLRNDQVDPEEDRQGMYSLSPQSNADSIFSFKPLADSQLLAYESAQVSVLQPPKHGILNRDLLTNTNTFKDVYSYYPNPGYVGNDKVIFLVNIEGYKVKVVSFIKVLGGDTNPGLLYNKYCPRVNPWKISSSAGNTLLATSLLSQSGFVVF